MYEYNCTDKCDHSSQTMNVGVCALKSRDVTTTTEKEVREGRSVAIDGLPVHERF